MKWSLSRVCQQGSKRFYKYLRMQDLGFGKGYRVDSRAGEKKQQEVPGLGAAELVCGGPLPSDWVCE
jgi:hypothetical protein